MSSTYSVETIVCHRCKGRGLIEHSELTCYHKGEYDYTYSVCEVCEGGGLVEKKIETITTYKPTRPDLTLAQKYPYIRK